MMTQSSVIDLNLGSVRLNPATVERTQLTLRAHIHDAWHTHNLSESIKLFRAILSQMNFKECITSQPT